MKKIVIGGFLFGMVSFCQPLFSQVEFKIQQMAKTEYYTLSAFSSVDWAGPQSLVSTAQVTIKVATGGFEILAVQNLNTTARWQVNGRTNAPKEDPEFDYIYFGLTDFGTASLHFEKDKEVTLFAFKAGGRCTGGVALVDNKTDKFMGKNSMHVNIGNQMTVLGAGGDAFVGNRDGGKAGCFESSLNHVVANEILIFPNPVLGNEVEFSFENTGTEDASAQVVLYNIMGQRIYFEKFTAKPGINQRKLDVSEWPIGVYQMEISGLGFRPIYQELIRTQ